MQSRTLREGALGLFVILGLGLFGVVVLWLRGVSLGRRTYQFVVEFENVLGMQNGAPVRYRGVTVGRLVQVQAGANGVDANLEISSAQLKIPRPMRVEANQGGLIAETTIDIIPPEQPLLNPAALASPVSSKCDSSQIICDGDRLQGEIGISFEVLMRSSTDFTEAFAKPELVDDLQVLLKNTSRATEEIAQLARDMSALSQVFQEEVEILSDSAIVTTQTVGVAAEQFGETARQLDRLAQSASDLLESNRVSLVATLDNVSRLSFELSRAAEGLTPLLQRTDNTLAMVNENLVRFEQSRAIDDLETLVSNAAVLSENAAIASENLRDVSESVSDPANLLLLQQTLESARSTFQNVEKITSDLDDLTGDPIFRENLRRMVNGLSSLVSLTEQLEQQTYIAQQLSPLEPLNESNEEMRRWGNGEMGRTN
ncbi:MAG: MCE family protein [Cyanobacteria bacterium SBC]|nr:MCE family protein [Cyanobacteria bacterium SBC]